MKNTLIILLLVILASSCEKDEYSSNDDGYNGSSGSLMHSGCIRGIIRDSVTLDTLHNYHVFIWDPNIPHDYGNGEYGICFSWGQTHYQYIDQPTIAHVSICDSANQYVGYVTFPISLIEDSTISMDILF